jgi:hypothetical protein
VRDSNPPTVEPIPHPLSPAETADHEYAREYTQNDVDRFGDGGDAVGEAEKR